MFEPRIALIAEGETDHIVIEALLKAFLGKPFIPMLLQPERTGTLDSPGSAGSGWGGVYNWWRDFVRRGGGTLETDPASAIYDLFIIHIDADVATKSYSDHGRISGRPSDLPCVKPCPPPDDTVNSLRKVVLGWLSVDRPGKKTVLCIPSVSTETWLFAALFPEKAARMPHLECKVGLDRIMAAMPMKSRIKKNVVSYRNFSGNITRNTGLIVSSCSQAARFKSELSVAAGKIPVRA